MSKTFTAQVVSARRVTIPYELCLTEAIQEGDFVEFKILAVKKAAEIRES